MNDTRIQLRRSSGSAIVDDQVRASLAELLSRDLEPTLAARARFLASSGAATSPAKGRGCRQEPPSAATPGSSGSHDFKPPQGVSRQSISSGLGVDPHASSGPEAHVQIFHRFVT